MDIDVRVTGKTKLLGLVGNPVEHSISPQLHNTLSSLLDWILFTYLWQLEKKTLRQW